LTIFKNHQPKTKKMKVTVKQHQSVWDVATQYTGSSEHALAILQANGKSTPELNAGGELLIPQNLISRRMIAFFVAEQLDIACLTETNNNGLDAPFDFNL
jgi:hypothetical protein